MSQTDHLQIGIRQIRKASVNTRVESVVSTWEPVLPGWEQDLKTIIKKYMSVAIDLFLTGFRFRFLGISLAGSEKLVGDLFLLLCTCLAAARLHGCSSARAPGPFLGGNELRLGQGTSCSCCGTALSWAVKATRESVPAYEEQMRGLQVLCVVL